MLVESKGKMETEIDILECCHKRIFRLFIYIKNFFKLLIILFLIKISNSDLFFENRENKSVLDRI